MGQIFHRSSEGILQHVHVGECDDPAAPSCVRGTSLCCQLVTGRTCASHSLFISALLSKYGEYNYFSEHVEHALVHPVSFTRWIVYRR